VWSQTLAEAIEKYEEFGEKVFSKKLPWLTRWDATYDHTVVEKLLKQVIRESPLMLDEDAPLKDASRPCKTFVITTKLDKHNSEPIIMRSYDLDEDKDASIKIWEAGRATSAAPTYFKPITINNERYSDGGTIANNPSHNAIMEAAKVWKLDDIGCIVSLGTGPSGKHTLDDATEEVLGKKGRWLCQKILSQSLYYRLQLAFYSLQAMTSTELTHLKTLEMVKVFRRMRVKSSMIAQGTLDDVYYRLNLTYQEAKVGLDAYKEMPLLQNLATRFMKTDPIAITAKVAIAKLLATTAKQRLPPLWLAPEDPVRVLEFYILSLQQETHVRFSKLARINNTAQKNFISGKFAAQLGLTKTDVVAHEKTGFVLPSHKMIYPESIVELNLTIGNNNNMHIETFFVVNDDGMPADVMVGVEFTITHKALGRDATKEELKILAQATKGGIDPVAVPVKPINYSNEVPLVLNGDNSWGGADGVPIYEKVGIAPICGQVGNNISFLDMNRPMNRSAPTRIAYDADEVEEEPEEAAEGPEEKEGQDENDSSDEVAHAPGAENDDEYEDEVREGEKLLEELIKHDELDIDEKDENGQTFLSQSAKYGDAGLVKILLKSGKADVNAKDYSGRTPLAVAARNGHLEVVKLLLEAPGVDTAAKDMYGETALSLAEINGYKEIAELLKRAGGSK
jgi:predicted acylesterase/phospholipase RssA